VRVMELIKKGQLAEDLGEVMNVNSSLYSE
jgi:hypothetical protein